MAKLRSFFVSELDSLNDQIVSLLDLSVEGDLTEYSFNRFLARLDFVHTLVHHKFYSDLIRKK